MVRNRRNKKLIGRSLLILLGLFGLCTVAEIDCAAENEFHFEYVLVFGPGDTPLRLTIDGHQATLIRPRAIPEIGGDTIGAFRAQVGDEDLLRLERAFPQPPPAFSLAPDEPNLLFTLKSAKRTVELRVPHRPDALMTVSNLTTEVERISKELLGNPYRALSLEIVSPGAEAVFGRPVKIEVRLHNAGVKPVRIAPDEGELWIEAAVRTPPAKGRNEMAASPVWEIVGRDSPLEQTLLIQEESSISVSVPVTFQEPMQTLVRARLRWLGRLAGQEGNLEWQASVASKSVPLNIRKD
jgi:hypothetical protein